MTAVTKVQKFDESTLEFDTPVDLDAALFRIELLTKAIEIGLEKIEEQAEKISGQEDRIADLEEKSRDAREQADEILEMVIEDLERVRQWIVGGRTGEALHTLNRVMQEFDERCTRATVVAPMLPMAGSFGS
jgi:phage shock protein A